MGKPHVPYRAKRLIDACLESLWDFEVLQGPGSLQLSMSDGEHRIDCRWKKSSDLDGGGRETTRYKNEYMTHYPAAGHPTRATIDEIETIIRTTHRIRKQHDNARIHEASKRPARGNVPLPAAGIWPWPDMPAPHPQHPLPGQTLF